MDSLPLLGLSLAELTAWVEAQGQPAYRAKQIHSWLYQQGARNLTEISVLPQRWRSELGSITVGRSVIALRSGSRDGTVKYLLRLGDGLVIETVGIPTSQRLTVCVSTQVGCPMACDFCATGKGGWQRNLTPPEIVDQVLTVQEDFSRRVSHVVFMGMGEPLLNLDQVLAALRCLREDVGIGQRSMTISTVGVPGQIRRLAQHHLQTTLAVSLHAPDQQLREQLIPSARHYPLEDLLAEAREYVQVTGRRISFEYILLGGFNDLPHQAMRLAGLVKGFPSHVNLIPYNPVAGAGFERPSPQRIQAFLRILTQGGIAATVRQARGLDQQAACGQLRATQQQTA